MPQHRQQPRDQHSCETTSNAMRKNENACLDRHTAKGVDALTASHAIKRVWQTPEGEEQRGILLKLKHALRALRKPASQDEPE